MEIDKENQVVVFSDLKEITTMAWALRHCAKQWALEDDEVQICAVLYDKLFDAFIRKKETSTQ